MVFRFYSAIVVNEYRLRLIVHELLTRGLLSWEGVKHSVIGTSEAGRVYHYACTYEKCWLEAAREGQLTRITPVLAAQCKMKDIFVALTLMYCPEDDTYFRPSWVHDLGIPSAGIPVWTLPQTVLIQDGTSDCLGTVLHSKNSIVPQCERHIINFNKTHAFFTTIQRLSAFKHFE